MDALKYGHFIIAGVYVGTTRFNEMIGKFDATRLVTSDTADVGYWGLRKETSSGHKLLLDVGGDASYGLVTDKDYGSTSEFGILKVGGELTVESGVVKYALPAATSGVRGGLKFLVEGYSGEGDGVGSITFDFK